MEPVTRADHIVNVVHEQILSSEHVERKWESLMKTELAVTERPATTNVSIFHVAPTVRRIKPEDFSSAMFHLGVYHAKKVEAKLSEGDAWKIGVARLLKPEDFEGLVGLIKEKEQEVKNLYRGELGIQTSGCLAMSLALDALFIAAVCVFFSCSSRPAVESLQAFVSPAFQGFNLTNYFDAMRDMLLLENQIPFFLLEDAVRCLSKSTQPSETFEVPPVCFGDLWLFDFRKGHERCLQRTENANTDITSAPQEPCLQKLHDCFSLFKEAIGAGFRGLAKANEQSLGVKTRTTSTHGTKPCHLLDHLYNIYTCQKDVGSYQHGSTISPVREISEHIPSASYLLRHGIRFEGVSKNCTGIEFVGKTATLRLPVINIDDLTEAILRNLMAYEEHMHPTAPRVLSSYVVFMDGMIDTGKDVEELVKWKIIKCNGLGSPEETARMFNRLGKAISVTSFNDPNNPFYGVARDLQKHCEDPLHAWIADFKETYVVNRPWLLISIAAAAILFVFAFLQTYYTMRAYYHGHN